LGQVGRQLTDVVETAKASSITNTTLLPLFMTGQSSPARIPRGGSVPINRHPTWDVRFNLSVW
jgi:hypothetical protein